MLTYDLDKRGSTPLYDYLYQCIRQDIISGRLQAGERLPSKRTLAQHLSVGIITVANAYAQLAVEGYITSREKKGYFVEDVSSYRVRRKAAAAMLPEAAEREYFADFKANRISLQNFPLATWTRLMRETLSVHNEELLKTVPYKGVYELRKAIADYLAHNRAMQVDRKLSSAPVRNIFTAACCRCSAMPAPSPSKNRAIKNSPPSPPASAIPGSTSPLMTTA